MQEDLAYNNIIWSNNMLEKINEECRKGKIYYRLIKFVEYSRELACLMQVARYPHTDQLYNFTL